MKPEISHDGTRYTFPGLGQIWLTNRYEGGEYTWRAFQILDSKPGDPTLITGPSGMPLGARSLEELTGYISDALGLMALIAETKAAQTA